MPIVPAAVEEAGLSTSISTPSAGAPPVLCIASQDCRIHRRQIHGESSSNYRDAAEGIRSAHAEGGKVFVEMGLGCELSELTREICRETVVCIATRNST